MARDLPLFHAIFVLLKKMPGIPPKWLISKKIPLDVALSFFHAYSVLFY
jgi:hypothetical protein